jgi:hypothetical protein
MRCARGGSRTASKKRRAKTGDSAHRPIHRQQSRPVREVVAVKFAIDFCPSQDGFDTLAPNDIQQHERRTAWPLGPTFQLRHIADRQIEAAGKDGLT